MPCKRISAALCLASVTLAGCHSKEADHHKVGGDLPVTSSNSVALPDATNAADAPRAPEVVESQDATLTTYRDLSTGLSFQYPTVWRPSQGAVLQAPQFSEVAGKPRMTQEFSPKGNYYEPTVLRALIFSYGVKGGSNAAECAALPGKVSAASQRPHAVTYNGRQFTEAGAGDAGMCTQVTAAIDSTLRGNQCLIFERDFVTGCPYAKTDKLPRPLTDRETADLQRHLDDVMRSVQISDPAK